MPSEEQEQDLLTPGWGEAPLNMVGQPCHLSWTHPLDTQGPGAWTALGDGSLASTLSQPLRVGTGKTECRARTNPQPPGTSGSSLPARLLQKLSTLLIVTTLKNYNNG